MIMGIILFAISYYFSAFVLADGMLNQYQQINDSGALVSARGDFKLGFFSTSNLRSRYLGIWYNNIPVQTLIWVANRDRLLNDSSGGLKIGDDGNLILLDSGGIVAWSAGIQNISSKPTVALLLDSGNLVLRSENGGNTESYIWQSFDHPSDTLIAGMKLGWDLRVGLDRYLTSRKSADDPSPGDISYRFDLDGLPQGVIRKGSVKQHRTGIWNGLQFNGVEPQNSIFNTNFIDNSEEVYFKFVICSCLDGYIPKSSQDWNTMVWNGGCIRKYPLNCLDRQGFLAFKGMIIPDLLEFSLNTKYRSDSKEKKKKKLLLVIIPVSVALLSFLLTSCVMWKRIKQPRGSRPNIPFKDDENIDLPIFNIVTITNATNNFSISNKIGEGGFGLVYKGQLSTGQEIAVKRLSENSKQGLGEFKNEVILIAKLQHQNFVRLLGCCIQGEERMLIYEYLPNGNLSSFIFDTTKSNSLEWRKRFDIIVGIARGLLYLHRDSRLRIIHRDLQASNVLLDNEMNPKISYFGIARAFGGDQTLGKTRRVIGTYGYMSPEYILRGLFSMKSDVFSFGVLVLEIVSEQQNRKFRHPNHTRNLLGHGWKLWIEGNAINLVDEKLETSTMLMSEVIKCIQIGLLCVQQRPTDRPTMSSVVSMLDNEGAMLPRPKQPGFYTEGSSDETELASTTGIKCSTNKTTLTILLGR
ncbi:G-type lectin S-receptor-like serine/threonine-protein kinase At4g27290 [Camellia sinensis]|uniref:G-type lectin S-receptor-like serine/threonine-protein kinase At4g27290 n=1 Tax=Camellia sinensis TaxID=4442 RepID=UPI0010361950|nr:G-type lectin S-receptor-like serine/threonine-protein kinase At4g27290 [Camellia sinensis]